MPQIRIRDQTGTLRTITRIRMRDQTGTLQTIKQIRMRDQTNTLRTIYGSMTATLDKSVAYGEDSGPASSGAVVTETVTVSVSGGVAPYTYAWERVANGAGITIVSSTSAATTFSANVPNYTDRYGDYRCKVTDNVGTVAYTSNVFADLVWLQV